MESQLKGEVEIKVDLKKREELRRLHTATHIVNFCSRQILGNHVWQNGSNMKNEFGTLDITHYDNLSQDEIFEIEKLANQTVFEDKKVKIEELDRGEAEQKYGFVLYQGGAIPMKTLRVVSILDSDIEACGGIHMQSTGGIGLIKIVDSQKIQDGVVRLKFVVNNFALDFVAQKQSLINDVKEVFSVDEGSLVKTSEKFFNDWKAQKKEIENLKKQLKQTYIDSILDSKKDEFKIDGDFDMGFVMELFTSVIGKKKTFKLVSNKFIIATQGVEVEGSKKKISKRKFNIFII